MSPPPAGKNAEARAPAGARGVWAETGRSWGRAAGVSVASTDGVWAPAWYDAVERSTGFAAPAERTAPPLPDALRRIADAARPHYQALAAHRLTVSS